MNSWIKEQRMINQYNCYIHNKIISLTLFWDLLTMNLDIVLPLYSVQCTVYRYTAQVSWFHIDSVLNRKKNDYKTLLWFTFSIKTAHTQFKLRIVVDNLASLLTICVSLVTSGNQQCEGGISYGEWINELH